MAAEVLSVNACAQNKSLPQAQASACSVFLKPNNNGNTGMWNLGQFRIAVDGTSGQISGKFYLAVSPAVQTTWPRASGRRGRRAYVLRRTSRPRAWLRGAPRP